MQRLHNSREHYKTLQLQKKYFYEKQLQSICTLLTSTNFLATCGEYSGKGALEFQKVKHLDQDLNLETRSITNSQFNSSLIGIQEKIKGFLDPSLKTEFFQEISSLGENYEISCGDNIESSIDESEWSIKPGTSRVENENKGESCKTQRETSLIQPEEEQIEEINVFIEGLEFTTIGDQAIPDKELGLSYLIREDCEAREDTLNYTRTEIPVMRKTWKSFLCSCIFKTFR